MRLALAAILLAVLACLLSACGVHYAHRTHVRELPDEVATTLTAGDSREKVRSILGEPLVDARALGLEVYRKSGRDFDVAWWFVPWAVFPVWGGEVVVFALALYDEDGRLKEMAADTRTPRKDFRINAGGFRFVNTFGEEPGTLLAPAIPWDKLAKVATIAQKCTLFVIVGECVTKYVSIDDGRKFKLAPNDTYCAMERNNNLYGTFFSIDLDPGMHIIRFHPEKRHSDFEAEFECETGEKVFAGLEAEIFHDAGWASRLEGSILIGTSPPKNLVKMGDLRPILQHMGTRYGQFDGAGESSR